MLALELIWGNPTDQFLTRVAEPLEEYVAHVTSNVPPLSVVAMISFMAASNYKKIFTIYFPLIIISIILWPKLPLQDNPNYFDFAGENSHNVLSNIPFFLVGLFGIYSLRKKRNENGKIFIESDGDSTFALSANIFSIGVMLTAFGSAYFHADPNPQTLFWDRLPMTISFAGMFGMITVDRLFQNMKQNSIYILLLFSIGTVIYWSLNHDLRPYIILQFVGGFYVFLTAICTRSQNLLNKKIFLSMGFYAIAKIFEFYDKQIFAILKITNGHSLKHLSAAISAFFLLP